MYSKVSKFQTSQQLQLFRVTYWVERAHHPLKGRRHRGARRSSIICSRAWRNRRWECRSSCSTALRSDATPSSPHETSRFCRRRCDQLRSALLMLEDLVCSSVALSGVAVSKAASRCAKAVRISSVHGVATRTPCTENCELNLSIKILIILKRSLTQLNSGQYKRKDKNFKMCLNGDRQKLNMLEGFTQNG